MKLLKQVKKHLARYRQWQLDPMFFAAKKDAQQQHHCHCCGTDYTGVYCPICGQKAGDKHITWSSIRQGVMDLWGMGTRSLPYTLWQLVWRPGYLIADYINGKRQISFPPIKMLVLVALFLFIIINWISPDEALEEAENDDFFTYEIVFDWISEHYDAAIMVGLSSFILPTYFIFRHAPRCNHHTLPEGFFIQVFIGVQILMSALFLAIIGELIPDSFIDDDEFLEMIVAILVFLLIYRTYRQLFGYGYWGTLWRISATTIAAALNVFLLTVVVFIIGCLLKGDYDRAWKNLIIRFPLYLSGSVLVTYIAALISKRNTKTATNSTPEDEQPS